MGQETQEMRLPVRTPAFDAPMWCSERRATVRAGVGMVVSVTEDTGKKRRWLLFDARSQSRRQDCGTPEAVKPRDPRHQAVLGKRVGDREMYQWGGRPRALRLERIEPGPARLSRLGLAR